MEDPLDKTKEPVVRPSQMREMPEMDQLGLAP